MVLLLLALAPAGFLPPRIASAASTSGFLYALRDSLSGNLIYGYRVDDGTGALTLLSGFPVATGGIGDAGAFSERLSIDPTNLRLYAINGGSATISAFGIDPLSGALSALPFSPVPLPAGSWACLAVHPAGSPVVAADSINFQIASFQVSATTAISAPNSPYGAGVTPFSCAFSRDGNYFYTGGAGMSPGLAALQVDVATGELAHLAGSPFNAGVNNPLAYATDANGRLFAASLNAADVRAFSLVDGVPSVVSNLSSGLGNAIHGVLHPSGYYFVADRQYNKIGAFQIQGVADSTTITPVVGSPFSVVSGTTTSILALSTSGKFLYAADSFERKITSFSVDPSTGGLSKIAAQALNAMGTTAPLTGLAFAVLSPNLQITKTHAGRFSVGTTSAYTIQVRNDAFAAGASSPITVTDALPSELTYAGTAAPGWSCGASGGNVSCVHPGPLAPGATLPTLALSVTVGSSPPGGVITNTAVVTTAGELSTSDNSASDPTIVGKMDQTIAFPLINDRNLGDAPFVLSATTTSGLAVTFDSSSPSVCLVNGTLGRLLTAGSCSFVAYQSGDPSFNPAPAVTRTFSVIQPPTATPTVGPTATPSPLPSSGPGGATPSVQPVDRPSQTNRVFVPNTMHSYKGGW